jgi:hypothetical protein
MDIGLVGPLIGIISAYLVFAGIDLWMRLKFHRRGA